VLSVEHAIWWRDVYGWLGIVAGAAGFIAALAVPLG